jgi:hypothetical protein
MFLYWERLDGYVGVGPDYLCIAIWQVRVRDRLISMSRWNYLRKFCYATSKRIGGVYSIGVFHADLELHGITIGDKR